MIIMPRRSSAFRRNTSPLSSILSSAVFDLDATISTSYPGTGQVWKNIIPSPADGSAMASYDFTLGNTSSATTDDPTFTGSAGDAAAYWAMDGGDFWSMDTASVPAFLKSIHKTTGGSDFAFCFAGVLGSTVTGSIFNTRLGSPSRGIGINLAATTSSFIQTGDGGNSLLSSAPPGYTANASFIGIYSHSHSTNKSKIWINTGTGAEKDQTYNTTTTDSSDKAYIATLSTGFGWVASGNRLVHASCFNEYMTDAKAAAIITLLKSRHARSYA